jgi:hypothetical protein
MKRTYNPCIFDTRRLSNFAKSIARIAPSTDMLSVKKWNGNVFSPIGTDLIGLISGEDLWAKKEKL